MTELTGLFPLLRSIPAWQRLQERLQHTSTLPDLQVISAARPFVLAALAQEWDGPVLFLTARVDRAWNVAGQLPVWLPDRPVYRFAEPVPHFYERAPWGDAAIRSRIAALAALHAANGTRGAPIIVGPARALMQRSMSAEEFAAETLTLRPGMRLSPDALLAHCLRLGYAASTLALSPGSFSRRGGLIDIFPQASRTPLRVDYFDDEIEQLRRFDPASQRSLERLEEAKVTPAREVLPHRARSLAARLGGWFDSLPKADSSGPLGDREALEQETLFPALEQYLPWLDERPASLLDHAPANALVVVEDWSTLRETVAGLEENALKQRGESVSANQIAPDIPLPYLTWDALVEAIEERRHIHLGRPPGGDETSVFSLRECFAPGPRFGGQLRLMLDDLRQLRRERQERIVVVTAQAPRLAALWREQESFIPTLKSLEQVPQPGSLCFVDGALQEGWRLRPDDGDLLLLSDQEIFGWSRPEPRRSQTAPRPRAPDRSYSDLHDGDIVVHIDYGFGRFAGLRRRTLGGTEREYLLVEYEGTDMVFVPIHQADRLTRYIGADNRTPALNRLGRPDWDRVRSKTRKAIQEEAKELLELYARRAQARRAGFNPDNAWQHELEASFPFIETEDQLRAVREVKADMERDFPMDRLICGDVGYGKTEVALRAAFKAVMDGKQVAMLVPTTVLAQQHLESFSRRLVPFPVKVEMLSRFRTRDEQAVLLPRITSGEIDIVIGTHRLLGSDVVFRDLGLLIIDEEQRFGVTHKEHFKRLRTQVDILTLTATPIPRTLYMSLTGVRDISMIQTPPEERLPVITHTGQIDELLMRQAILRELERGGQVFYVHNRVRSIDMVRGRLERLVPEARCVVGHGQMHERSLESVMSAFSRGEHDVLVSTSIVENGLDIPNVNTLIVDRADRFGMAQLYQMRGRVGRGARQAWAYFFHGGTGDPGEEALARLDILAENSELGAGLQIAMRDLELRGAGDILSHRQTGQVSAVGLQLYTRMLSDAVRGMKEGSQRREGTGDARLAIDLPLPAYLPAAWVHEMELRLQIYRRIAGLTHKEEVMQIREELRDRFGALPPAVVNLLYQIDVKLLGQSAGATAITLRNHELAIRLPWLPTVNRDQLQRALGVQFRVTRTAVERDVDVGQEDWQSMLQQLLERMARLRPADDN
ncbi:MAG: transcription-repair coupling factor [Anaerolineaceae bacterium]|nr:transcription-repair coupling factor [Anaerolineaceae bacterium]MDE0328408.1 transcription-repair coupling factor [Anaerolineaceae bacterium]